MQQVLGAFPIPLKHNAFVQSCYKRILDLDVGTFNDGLEWSEQPSLSQILQGMPQYCYFPMLDNPLLGRSQRGEHEPTSSYDAVIPST